MAAHRFAEVWVRAHDAGDAPDARLGDFTLRASQATAVRRILEAFDACGGALLADPPGAGKTIVALAVARAASRGAGALVVAPATVRGQWERSARRAGVAITFASMEALSRRARVSRPRGAVVIVDEAHHARTQGTIRYERIAALCAGARVLLLSATPVVNRTADRDAMLSLFLPSSGTGEAGSALERCVIRRDSEAERNPSIRRLPALLLPRRAAHARIGEALAALPPPLPTEEGRAALALVRITLAMAWSSSLAALDAALRRRIQRGEALADLLAVGGAPSRAALREWIVGDDATQLAFPALFAVPVTSGVDVAERRRVLARHMDAVRALRETVRPEVEADARDRASVILDALRAQPHERLVVFARHAWTIRALWSALRWEPGVVAVVGDRTMAAHGAWRRDDVLAALGPRAKPLREGDPRAIRLLLTTDLLAEGIELQGVSRLVHADRAWTPATLEQREGRVARGARREVTVTRFIAPVEAVPLLRLGRRLARKDRDRRAALRHAACLERADRLIRERLRARRTTGPSPSRGSSPCAAFLAALRSRDDAGERIAFVAGERRGRRWRIADSSCAIARVAGRAPGALHGDDLRSMRRALSRWRRTRAMRALVGGDAPPAARTASTWRRLRARVDRLLRSTPHAARATRAAALEGALATLGMAGAAAVARMIRKLLADAQRSTDDDFESALLRAAADHARERRGNDNATVTLLALDPRR